MFADAPDSDFLLEFARMDRVQLETFRGRFTRSHLFVQTADADDWFSG